VRKSKSILNNDKAKIIADFAPDKKVLLPHTYLCRSAFLRPQHDINLQTALLTCNVLGSPQEHIVVVHVLLFQELHAYELSSPSEKSHLFKFPQEVF